MDDRDVIRAFVSEGARRAFSPTLHLEGDCLLYDGWWQACFRVAPDTFSLRDEEPPGETPVLAELAEALEASGLRRVDVNVDLLYAITYTEIALGLVPWSMWSIDEQTARVALARRAGHDTFLGDDDPGSPVREGDYSAELGGARRISGLPPSVVLAVGMGEDRVKSLQEQLDDSRVVSRAFGEIEPESCGALVPNLVLVDATDRRGEEFAMQLRAAACGRFLPVVTVRAEGPVPGADAAVDPAGDTATWADTVRRLLP